MLSYIPTFPEMVKLETLSPFSKYLNCILSTLSSKILSPHPYPVPRALLQIDYVFELNWHTLTSTESLEETKPANSLAMPFILQLELQHNSVEFGTP